MYQHNVCWILFLTLQPKPATETLCRAPWESLSLSSSSPPFPVKAAYWEPPTPPSFPMDFSPGDCLACSSSMEGKAGLWLGALSGLFFVNALKMSLLVTLARPLAHWLMWNHSLSSEFSVPSGTSEVFRGTAGWVLCLPWDGLFSVWVSFKRGERFVAS